jgi:hypothetical protein
MSLTKAQVTRLLTVRPEGTFEAKQGLTYMPTHEVKAELSRIFGPGNWDHTIHDVRLLWESSEDVTKGSTTKTMWRACYLVACTLRVRDYEGSPIFETTEYHAEANSNLPDRGEAHAMAVTSAESYALRRAALDLGDAFGLHLYDNGSKAPLVKGTLMTFGDEDSPLYDAEAEAARKEAMERARAEAAAKMQGAMKQGEDTTEATE